MGMEQPVRKFSDSTRPLYETDEHQWMLEQIELLQAGKMAELDHGNLLVYLTEMTIRDRRQLENRFVRLLQHLLKFHVQSEMATRSWLLTVLEQQRKINGMLNSAPSLNTYAPSLFADAYPHAVKEAAAETGRDRSQFPSSCPWTMEEALMIEPSLIARLDPFLPLRRKLGDDLVQVPAHLTFPSSRLT